MHCFKIYWSHAILALLLCASMLSCANDELVVATEEPLPEGSCPLQFKAKVAEPGDAFQQPWIEGDTIGVQIGKYPVFGRYQLNANGTLMDELQLFEWHTRYAYVAA